MVLKILNELDLFGEKPNECMYYYCTSIFSKQFFFSQYQSIHYFESKAYTEVWKDVCNYSNFNKKALLGLSCHNHKDQYERIMVIETVVVDCSCQ